MTKDFSEFPKAVYHPDGRTEVIARDEDRQEGFLDLDDLNAAGDNGEAAAKDAEAAAKKAEADERTKIRAFLDAHAVDYSKNLGIEKLRVLSDELEAHLSAQGAGGGDST